MAGKRKKGRTGGRRRYTDELKEEAVQMLLDGHQAKEVASNLGLSGPGVLYRWKEHVLKEGGQTALSLEARNRELVEQLRRVERERDILKKALAIFSQRT